jgi:hypothetical protein
MSEKVKPPAKAKKIQVFVGTELKTESNVHEDVIPTLHELKTANVPEIKVVNHHYKVTHLHKKGRYDKNYRVVEGIYEANAPAVTEEEAK